MGVDVSDHRFLHVAVTYGSTGAWVHGYGVACGQLI